MKKTIAILLALMLLFCFASASMAFAWPQLTNDAQTNAEEKELGTPRAGGSTFFGGIMIGLSVVATIINRKDGKNK